MELRIFKLHVLITMILLCCYSFKLEVLSDAGIHRLDQGCSNYNVTSLSNFNSNRNATFRRLRAEIEGGKRFATAEELSGPDPVNAMLQCRDYMSTNDCLACFNAASTQIRNCSDANGGRVVYDGCFLRYERNDFYSETTRDANREYCENRTTSSPATAFQATVGEVLRDPHSFSGFPWKHWSS